MEIFFVGPSCPLAIGKETGKVDPKLIVEKIKESVGEVSGKTFEVSGFKIFILYYVLVYNNISVCWSWPKLPQLA